MRLPPSPASAGPRVPDADRPRPLRDQEAPGSTIAAALVMPPRRSALQVIMRSNNRREAVDILIAIATKMGNGRAYHRAPLILAISGLPDHVNVAAKRDLPMPSVRSMYLLLSYAPRSSPAAVRERQKATLALQPLLGRIMRREYSLIQFRTAPNAINCPAPYEALWPLPESPHFQYRSRCRQWRWR